MAIVAILGGLAVTAVSALSDAQNFGSQVGDFQQMVDDARAYAMANNTYVLLGIEEVDASKPTTVVPQASGIGRVAVAAVSTTDGTNGLMMSGSSYSINQAHLVAINRLRLFPNLHLQYLTATVPLTSPLANRYSITAGTGSQNSTLLNTDQMLGYPQTTGATFMWPLTGTTQYTFDRVVEFGPDGSAIFVPSGTTESVSPKWLEIALQQTHGDSVPSMPTTATLSNGKAGQQVAAIQIDGITGAAQLYRQ